MANLTLETGSGRVRDSGRRRGHHWGAPLPATEFDGTANAIDAIVGGAFGDLLEIVNGGGLLSPHWAWGRAERQSR